MSAIIRVRDVVRGDVLELGALEPILRGRYDRFRPTGPVELHDGLVQWFESGTMRTSRIVPAALGEMQPGERVLVRMGSDRGWWLFDVESVD